MAENKKSFVLYSDLIHTVKKMPLDKAGKLLLTILEYVNDEHPEVDDMVVDLVFEPIKQQLKRDLVKYETKRVQWSEAGKRSAESRKVKKNERTLTDVKQRSTDSTVNVNDSVNVTVSVNNIDNRKAKFKKLLIPFQDKYSVAMLKAFYEYWTEHGEKDKKMRFEKEKSYNLKSRLTRWSNSPYNNESNSNGYSDGKLQY